MYATQSNYWKLMKNGSGLRGRKAIPCEHTRPPGAIGGQGNVRKRKHTSCVLRIKLMVDRKWQSPGTRVAHALLASHISFLFSHKPNWPATMECPIPNDQRRVEFMKLNINDLGRPSLSPNTRKYMKPVARSSLGGHRLLDARNVKGSSLVSNGWSEATASLGVSYVVSDWTSASVVVTPVKSSNCRWPPHSRLHNYSDPLFSTSTKKFTFTGW